MRPNADFLTVTSIVASLMLGTPHSALMILALSDLAELMTSYTIERTRSSIKKMLSADDGDVWKVLEDGRVARTPIAQLHAGDTVAVHTGEKIAVDGVIASGVAVIDQSAITGEFVPVEKRAGDEVFAGHGGQERQHSGQGEQGRRSDGGFPHCGHGGSQRAEKKRRFSAMRIDSRIISCR